MLFPSPTAKYNWAETGPKVVTFTPGDWTDWPNCFPHSCTGSPYPSNFFTGSCQIEIKLPRSLRDRSW
ncbi:hypothetical protein Y1Q_0001207 [Alligator mississippiensis]|uniref:Uncharacterized protein n=1 Tax=Alligator mississippiensis TaxID=8496 RepID=A0A151PEJ4_ALLMI|nr:hypothetical protein Y1Q_0001207 [Alligator mississippiensis]